MRWLTRTFNLGFCWRSKTCFVGILSTLAHAHWGCHLQVFLEEDNMPGRYKMIAERPSRPAGDMLDYIIMQATGELDEEGNAPKAQDFAGQVAGVMRGMQRFMKSLSN